MEGGKKINIFVPVQPQLPVPHPEVKCCLKNNCHSLNYFFFFMEGVHVYMFEGAIFYLLKIMYILDDMAQHYTTHCTFVKLVPF